MKRRQKIKYASFALALIVVFSALTVTATLRANRLEREKRADIQQAVADGDASSAKMLCEKLLSSLAERNRICSISK